MPKAVIFKILPGFVSDYEGFDSIMDRYYIRERIIVAEWGVATHETPKNGSIYLIVAADEISTQWIARCR